VKQRDAAIQKLQTRINEVKDRIFADFSKTVGVASIREYEEKYLKEHKELDERRLNLKNQIAKIKSQ
jgi:structural maintenance of chromosome 1